MKLLQFIILSALFTMILNRCNGKTKDECLAQYSSDKTRLEDYRCCWIDHRFKETRSSQWVDLIGCESYPYDGDLLSLEIKVREAKIKFDGGEVDHASIDCSSKWIHSFFGLVLLLAFLL